jgi:hypothetical protein
MSKGEDEKQKKKILLTKTITSELKIRQSVRASFRLTQGCIEAISILAIMIWQSSLQISLKKVNLLVKAKTEKHFEHTVVSYLQASSKLNKNLITQIGQEQVEKVAQANLFGFNHRPDIAIGIDGTAIEIKVLKNSRSVRDVLGQALT